MAKKSSAPLPLQIRLNEDDAQKIKYIESQLAAPGMRISKADIVRRALHAFADQLRAKEQDRPTGKSLS